MAELTLDARLQLAEDAKKRHRRGTSCEWPNSCGACHFWTGYIAALEEIKLGISPVGPVYLPTEPRSAAGEDTDG